MSPQISSLARALGSQSVLLVTVFSPMSVVGQVAEWLGSHDEAEVGKELLYLNKPLYNIFKK